MKALHRSVILAVAILAILTASAQQASATVFPLEFIKLILAKQPILLGTTGACNNDFAGGPCKETSTLVLLDPRTGALIKKIGPVGFTVNGLAWDRASRKLYASTAIGCGETDPTTGFVSPCPFHGLITINPFTGKGTPVDPAAVNFGLVGNASPIHSIAIDVFGNMVGWYDEFSGATDTYVRINKKTGVATEFNDTGIDTSANGVSFGEFNLLWNIDTPRRSGTVLTQTAYLLNPFDGKPLLSVPLNPPTMAAIGDFHPVNHHYYGLKFQGFDPLGETFIEVVDLDFDPLTDSFKGTVTPLGQTVNFLHTLTFIPLDFLP